MRFTLCLLHFTSKFCTQTIHDCVCGMDFTAVSVCVGYLITKGQEKETFPKVQCSVVLVLRMRIL